MNRFDCPHCRSKLGNFYYADACPSCGHELAHNTRPLVSTPAHATSRERAWLLRLLRRVARFVES